MDQYSVQFDEILTNAMNAVSARLDKETNRTLNTTGSLAVDLRGSIQDFTTTEAIHRDQLVIHFE